MIIAIVAQKGGTGKTTTALAMASALTKRGYRVLSIDLDQQETFSFMARAKTGGRTIFSVLTGDCSAEEAIQVTGLGDVIPANKYLAGADTILKETGGEYRLRESLEGIRDRYDYIVLDCPPAMGSLSINAMTAADQMIVPVQADMVNMMALTKLYDSYKLVKKYTNKDLEIAGILLTMYGGRTTVEKEMDRAFREAVKSQMGSNVFASAIRRGCAVPESQCAQQDILTYSPKSKVAQDYMEFIREWLDAKRKG